MREGGQVQLISSRDAATVVGSSYPFHLIFYHIRYVFWLFCVRRDEGFPRDRDVTYSTFQSSYIERRQFTITSLQGTKRKLPCHLIERPGNLYRHGKGRDATVLPRLAHIDKFPS